VIDSDCYQEHNQRGRKHEQLLSSAGGNFCLLHGDPVLGGSSQ